MQSHLFNKFPFDDADEDPQAEVINFLMKLATLLSFPVTCYFYFQHLSRDFLHPEPLQY